MDINKELQILWNGLNNKQREYFKNSFASTTWREKNKARLFDLDKGKTIRTERAEAIYTTLLDFTSTSKSIDLSDLPEGKKLYLKTFNQLIQLAALYDLTELRPEIMKRLEADCEAYGNYDALVLALTWKGCYEPLADHSKLEPIAELIHQAEHKRELAAEKRETVNKALGLLNSYFLLIDHRGNKLFNESRRKEIVIAIQHTCSKHKVGKAEYFKGRVLMDHWTRECNWDMVVVEFIDTIKILDKHKDLNSKAKSFRLYSDFMDSVMTLGMIDQVEDIALRSFEPVHPYNRMIFNFTRIMAFIHMGQPSKALRVLKLVDIESLDKFNKKRYKYFLAACHFLKGEFNECKKTCAQISFCRFDNPGYNLGVRYLEMMVAVENGQDKYLDDRQVALRIHISNSKNKDRYRERDFQIEKMMRDYVRTNGLEFTPVTEQFTYGTFELIDMGEYIQLKVKESNQNKLTSA